jgi:ABC-type microcin C transport system permease subunit YejE
VYSEVIQVQNRGQNRVRQRRFERGEGRMKAILTLVIILLVLYSAWKIVPAYVNDYQLSDKMQEQARFAVVNRYTEDQIRDNIYKVVQDLEIPAKREDIKVVSTNAVVKISLQYTVPVDLLMYHMELHFSPNSENKALF